MRGLVVLAVCGATSVASANNLRCKPCTLPILGAHVQVEGSIDDAPFAVQLVGKTPLFQLGGIELRDVRIVAHDRGHGIDACVAGNVAGGRLTACTRLPPSLGGIEGMHAANIRWTLARGPVTGKGSAHLAWSTRGVRIDHGHVELATAARSFGTAALGAATIRAEVEGDLSHLALEVRGEARLASLDATTLHLRDIALPLALHEDHAMATAREPLRAQIASAWFELGSRTATLATPTLVVHDATPFAWTGFLSDPHQLSWSALSGLPVAAGKGAITFELGGEPRITDARVAVLGGEVQALPFAIGASDITIHAEGLAVADVLALASGDRVTGSGLLDGNFVLHRGTLGRAVFAARAPGVIRLRDPLWPKVANLDTSPALQRRILLALSDFAYDRWTIDVQPPGGDPESTILLHGRGVRIAQELDLTLNLRGLRELEK